MAAHAASDIGANVTDELARLAPAGLVGIHLKLPQRVPLEKDLTRVSRRHCHGRPDSWAEKVYPNLIYFNEAKKGGHFAAWEEPREVRARLARGVQHVAVIRKREIRGAKPLG